jgi:predicted dithiol-disulfide oxidoreductase (DUF899 family)
MNAPNDFRALDDTDRRIVQATQAGLPLTAREQLLVKEKAQTRARDGLAAERRRMPWMAVENEYAFEGQRVR